MIRTYFNKAMMADPGVSMVREYLQSSRDGTYAAGSISGCNTRKYHGLLVTPQGQAGDVGHVLLSALDETLTGAGGSWCLATRRYPGAYYPEGFRLVTGFLASPIPRWTYRAGPFILQKELLLAEKEGLIMIRYTLKTAPGELCLRLMPLLAFRNAHGLAKANKDLDGTPYSAANGMCFKPYNHYSPLYIQTSVPAVFQAAPDWYYNIEYIEEQKRGYECHEDLFTPGFFELALREGESVIFSAGLAERKGTTDDGLLFEKELRRKAMVGDVRDCLLQAAGRFISLTPRGAFIRAGFYWFGSWGRDTCIALPGLTLSTGNARLFEEIAGTLIQQLKNGLLPNTGTGEGASYNTADASLWFVWAVQQYARHTPSPAGVWYRYGTALKSVMKHYREGAPFGIHMEENGLLQAACPGYALTWMDAICDGVPVTQRAGKPVELNALWYNAICFCLELAVIAGDEDFIRAWDYLPSLCGSSFVQCFWSNEKGYLADCVSGGIPDWSMRPNQLLAVSLPYSPLPPVMQRAVVDRVAEELLTPRGLRTLSAGDPRYRGHYGGNQAERDKCYHQGAVWPWLLGHFADAYLKVYREAALPLLAEIYEGMSPALEEYGLYAIAELYDGDYPYKAGGAVAQAWSVAELIRMGQLITDFSDRYKAEQLSA